MYRPAHFAIDDFDEMVAQVRAIGFGSLVTCVDGNLDATPLPFLLDDPTPDTPLGALRAHFARANTHGRTLATGNPALVIFGGPDAYVSPNLYPGKPTDPKVVPTWNYVTVHAHGTVTVHDDPDWALQLVRDLTDHHESARPQPWSVDDAPADYIAKLSRAIVGISVTISDLQGKAKLSQNRPADRDAVASSLASAADPRSRRLAAEMT